MRSAHVEPLSTKRPPSTRKGGRFHSRRRSKRLTDVYKRQANAPLVEVAAEVQRQLTAGCEPASLKRRMMSMIKLEKNPLLRAAPLIVKDCLLYTSFRERGHGLSIIHR